MSTYSKKIILLALSIEVYIINLLVAIPVFFSLRWITHKFYWQNAQIRKIFPWIGTFILTPMVYSGSIYLWIWYMSYYPKMSFNKADWGENPSERYQLTEDIIESEDLIGLTKMEVTALLGAHDYSYDEDHWAFYIGFAPGLFNIDPSVLDVYFENERVIRVSQHET